MAIKSILKMGHPLLWQRATEVTEFDTPELHALIQDMHDSMQAAQGVGLAAPQIGVSLRVVIFGVKTNPRYPEAGFVPYTVLINPSITPTSRELASDWEGCLSVPGMRGKVERYQELHYRGFDPYGQVIDRQANGFHARVVQHECDHLDGILYPMRIQNLHDFGYEDALFPGQDSPPD